MLTEFEPRFVKDALENESFIEPMNEDIDQITKEQNLEPCS